MIASLWDYNKKTIEEILCDYETRGITYHISSGKIVCKEYPFNTFYRIKSYVTSLIFKR